MEQLLIQDVAAKKRKAVEEYTEKNSYGSELMGEEPKSVDDHENNTMSSLIDVIERYAYGNEDLYSQSTKEVKSFRFVEGDFGR
ncbi:hypothetical protein L6164_001211 [Bauhinia variegata]|uniref:Uncharacterized protein n=1 Tax=Bauhinia variegata TaxID=167791 RepID=A0ACB9Q8E3_BAUVA|nr:hypothetical protein L6164_001211 [Bauhinia variegata]